MSPESVASHGRRATPTPISASQTASTTLLEQPKAACPALDRPSAAHAVALQGLRSRAPASAKRTPQDPKDTNRTFVTLLVSSFRYLFGNQIPPLERSKNPQ
mmetsp:Transcript_4110/g.8877  ORF Transcript_4110/g.8877 Transcript_4110/m.8877 type:complete len:102 (+) Transcript_4110:1760-2065(+)